MLRLNKLRLVILLASIPFFAFSQSKEELKKYGTVNGLKISNLRGRYVDEWKELFKEAEYKGDYYWFTP